MSEAANLTLRILGMSWGVKNTCFEAPGVSLGGPGVSIGWVRILRVAEILDGFVWGVGNGIFMDACSSSWSSSTCGCCKRKDFEMGRGNFNFCLLCSPLPSKMIRLFFVQYVSTGLMKPPL